MGLAYRILALTDDPSVFDPFLKGLRDESFDPLLILPETPPPQGEGFSAAFEQLITESRYDLILYDSRWGVPFLEKVVKTWKECKRDCPILAVQKEEDLDEAVCLMNTGAHDVIPLQASARFLPALEREIDSATNRSERRNATNETQRLYRVLFESMGVASALCDRELTILLVNSEFCQLTQHNKEELERQKSIFRLFSDEEDMQKVAGYIEEVNSDHPHPPVKVETSITSKQGFVRNVVLTIAFISGTSDLILSFVDVSRERLMQQRLQTSEERFFRVFHEIEDPILITRAAPPVVLEVNQAFLTGLYYALDEVVGKDLNELEVFARPEKLEQSIKEVEEIGTLRDMELDMRNRSGEHRTYRWSIQQVGLDGEFFLLWIGRDITERKMYEPQLLQSEKLKSVGTLAGGIAHDFNNILSVILGYVDMGFDKTAPDSPIGRYLSEIQHAGERARELIKQILTFSQGEEGKSVRVSPGRVVKETLRFISSAKPETVTLKTNIFSTGSVLIDPVRLQQVIMNLCTNAFHAMEGLDGVLEINVGPVSIHAVSEEARSFLREGAYAEIEISDTGTGMAPEVRERIFEPFYTTKKVGSGTGLGLSVVHGIITEAGGKILVDSNPGKGTVFWIYLPAIDNKETGTNNGENINNR
ncbi:MAG: PAS domain S-box protein [Spirochaetales bacterium]|nr:PAS domain S-box protein [Spirochaetales bacterium]MCF7937515.1 PAS domain S-box protein [Spirochaetales bacterium]